MCAARARALLGRAAPASRVRAARDAARRRGVKEIRPAAARAGTPPDTFTKSASWFRVPYGDLRHALDFRLMAGARVAVLDASHTFCEDAVGGARGSGAKRWGSTGASAGAGASAGGLAALHPIPDFRALVAEAVKAASERGVRGQFASIDVGVVCDVASVRAVGRILHEKVQARLAPQPGRAMIT